ncbi:MAG: hypothetical protein IPN24_18400 [Betaproteobacteria bacterium]|nr:hypothetical protein [Betaproteobacteria bacterium]
MDVQTAFDLLAAWGSWSHYVSVGPVVRDKCGSLEHRYEAPAGSVMDEDRRPRPVYVNDELGMRIEKAVVSLGLPHRALVIAVFVKMVPLELAGRRVGAVNPRHVMEQALQQVADRLAGLPDQRRTGDRGVGRVRIAPAP